MAARDSVIVRTSVIGIAANLLLVIFKAAVGLVSGSIAVILDAVNNLSDALSSVITIIGTKLAAKKPDKKHPLGYGRIEYISAMIIAAIVLYAGVTSLVESVKKIIAPEAAEYSVLSLIIIGAAVAVKLVLGLYVKKTGERVNSGSLVASGSDALFDAILSFSVLVSAIVFIITGLSLEAWVGAVISLFIIKSGIEMIIETLDEILGRRIEGEYLREIKDTICLEPEVMGAYDLILHSYGPEKFLGSVHVEVPDTMTADEIDLLERRISDRVLRAHGVLLTGVGIYSVNTGDDEIVKLRSDINRIIMSHEGVLQTHGFFVDKDKKLATLDIIIDYSVDNRQELFEAVTAEVKKAFPDYTFHFIMDIDF